MEKIFSKNNKKRWICLLLVLCMVTGISPVNVYADSALALTIEANKNIFSKNWYFLLAIRAIGYNSSRSIPSHSNTLLQSGHLSVLSRTSTLHTLHLLIIHPVCFDLYRHAILRYLSEELLLYRCI